MSDFVNDWDQPVTYQCPNDGFLTGIKSVHNNQFEDRRFKYQCCEVPGRVGYYQLGVRNSGRLGYA